MQLSVHEVALLLKVPEKSVYQWIQKGGLPAFKVNENFRIHKSELLEWAISNKIEISPELFQKEKEAGAESLSLLGDALNQGGLYYDLSGSDKDSVLRSVVDCLPVPKESDRDFLFKALIAREALGSTAIGDGIAIPHIKTKHVDKLKVFIGTKKEGVDFNSLDGKPSTIFVLILSPENKNSSHIQFLATLSSKLSQKEIREKILISKTNEELISYLS